MITLNLITTKQCASYSAEERALMPLSDKELTEIPGATESRQLIAEKCQECPSLMACRIVGYMFKEEGVWGGMTVKERKRWHRWLMKPEGAEQALVVKHFLLENASPRERTSFQLGRRLFHPGALDNLTSVQ